MRRYRLSQTGGAGITEAIIIIALVATGTLGVITVHSDNIRNLFSAADNALGGEESTVPATREVDVPLPKSLADFAHNPTSASPSPATRSGSTQNLSAMRRALEANLAKPKGVAGRHLASQMPPSGINPDHLHKVGSHSTGSWYCVPSSKNQCGWLKEDRNGRYIVVKECPWGAKYNSDCWYKKHYAVRYIY